MNFLNFDLLFKECEEVSPISPCVPVLNDRACSDKPYLLVCIPFLLFLLMVWVFFMGLFFFEFRFGKFDFPNFVLMNCSYNSYL